MKAMVIACLEDFVTDHRPPTTDHRPNDGTFRSFERYRRNPRTPEVVTFHELLERARAIMDCSPTMVRYASPPINRTLGRHGCEVAAKAA